MLKKSVSIFLVFLFTLSPFQTLLAMNKFDRLDNESSEDTVYLNMDEMGERKGNTHVSTEMSDKREGLDDLSEEESIIYIETSDGKFISYESFLNSGDPRIKKPLFAWALLFEVLHRGLQVGVLGLNVGFWIIGAPVNAQQAYYGIKMIGALLVIPAALLIPSTKKVENAQAKFGFNNATTALFLKGFQNSSIDINVGGSVGLESLPSTPPISMPLPFLPLPIPVAAPQANDLEQDFDLDIPPLTLNNAIDIQISPFNKTEFATQIGLGDIASLLEIVRSGATIYIASYGAFIYGEAVFINYVESKRRPRYFEENLRKVLEKKIQALKDKIFPDHQKEDKKRTTIGSILRSPLIKATFPAARFAGSTLAFMGYIGAKLNNFDGFSQMVNFSTAAASNNFTREVLNESASFKFPFAEFSANVSGVQESGVDAYSQFAIVLFLTLDGLNYIENTQLMIIGGIMLFVYGLTGEILASVVR